MVAQPNLRALHIMTQDADEYALEDENEPEYGHGGTMTSQAARIIAIAVLKEYHGQLKLLVIGTNHKVGLFDLISLRKKTALYFTSRTEPIGNSGELSIVAVPLELSDCHPLYQETLDRECYQWFKNDVFGRDHNSKWGRLSYSWL